MVVEIEIKKNHEIDLLLYICTNNFEMVTKIINEENINSVIDKDNGNTSLHMAIIMNNDKMIRYLFEIGGNLMIENKNNEDCLDLLLKFQNPLLFDLLEEGLDRGIKNKESLIIELECKKKHIEEKYNKLGKEFERIKDINEVKIKELENKNKLMEEKIKKLKGEDNTHKEGYPNTRSKRRRLN